MDADTDVWGFKFRGNIVLVKCHPSKNFREKVTPLFVWPLQKTFGVISENNSGRFAQNACFNEACKTYLVCGITGCWYFGGDLCYCNALPEG